MPTSAAIDTAKVAGRRSRTLMPSTKSSPSWTGWKQSSGRANSCTLGNWHPGQNLGHLSAWIDYSYDGVPFQVPFFIRLMLRR